MPKDYKYHNIETLIKEFKIQSNVLGEYNPYNKNNRVIRIRVEAKEEIEVIKKRLMFKLNMLVQELWEADICNLKIITKD